MLYGIMACPLIFVLVGLYVCTLIILDLVYIVVYILKEKQI
jgi:hypothetical protein